MKNREEHPLISIVVPVYNVSEYLERCIFSLQNQTYSKIEIILVDDGSTDMSGLLCDKFALQDERIVVIHQKNKGLSGARNSGINIAKGKYITFVDSDDWIEESFCSNLMALLIKDGTDFAICTYFVSYENGDDKYVNQLFEDNCVVNSSELYPYIFSWRGISSWGKLYKTSLFKEIKYPEGKIDEDFATIYKLLFISQKVSFTKTPLYHYFSRSGSIVNSPFNIKKCDFANNAFDAFCFVKNNLQDKRINKLAEAFYFRRIDFVVQSIQNSGNSRKYKKIQRSYRTKLAKNYIKILFSQHIKLKMKIVIFLDILIPAIYQKHKKKKTMNKVRYFFNETIPIHFRKFLMKKKIKKLKNHDFSIISSNCLGGVIAKDFNQMQRSPTVNLFFYPKDFIKFLSNLDYYLSIDSIKDISKEYPIGLLGDIELHFLHYDSFQNAIDKWNVRKKRLNIDNLFIIMTDRDGCTKEDIEAFDLLPYKNKIIFTKDDYSEFHSVVYVKNFKGKYYNSFKNIFGKRYYDCFDFLGWFNNEK